MAQPKVIIHNPYPGDHSTDGSECWCNPKILELKPDADEFVDLKDMFSEIPPHGNN